MTGEICNIDSDCSFLTLWSRAGYLEHWIVGLFLSLCLLWEILKGRWGYNLGFHSTVVQAITWNTGTLALRCAAPPLTDSRERTPVSCCTYCWQWRRWTGAGQGSLLCPVVYRNTLRQISPYRNTLCQISPYRNTLCQISHDTQIQVLKYHTVHEVLINKYTEKVKLDFNCALR